MVLGAGRRSCPRPARLHRTATALVNVGCCYQWVTEEGSLRDSSGAALRPGSDEQPRATANPNHRWGHLAPLAEVPGFPLSAAGAALGIVLGRSAKNVANQVPRGVTWCRTRSSHMFVVLTRRLCPPGE